MTIPNHVSHTISNLFYNTFKPRKLGKGKNSIFREDMEAKK
jgi:hypothetical protein